MKSVCLVSSYNTAAVMKLVLHYYRDNFQRECCGHFDRSCGASGCPSSWSGDSKCNHYDKG